MAVPIKIKVTRIPFKRLGKLTQGVRAETRRALLQSSEFLVGLAQDNLQKQDKIVTGDLIGSFEITEKKINQFASRVEITNTAPHALAVEFGTQPGGAFPPIEKLRDWFLDRGLTPFSGQTVDQAVFLIAKKIQSEGLPPSFFFTEAFSRLPPDLKKRIRLVLSREIAKQRGRL